MAHKITAQIIASAIPHPTGMVVAARPAWKRPRMAGIARFALSTHALCHSRFTDSRMAECMQHGEV